MQTRKHYIAHIIKADSTLPNWIPLWSRFLSFSSCNDLYYFILFHFLLNHVVISRKIFCDFIAHSGLSWSSFDELIERCHSEPQRVQTLKVREEWNQLCHLIVEDIEFLSTHSLDQLSLLVNLCKQDLDSFVLIIYHLLKLVVPVFALLDRCYYLNILPFWSF